jgi:hypothetical protein
MTCNSILSNEQIQSVIAGLNNQISTIKGTFFSVLDDLKKNYILTHEYPTSSEYISNYNTNNSQIQGLQSNIIGINRSINSTINNLTNSNKKTEALISKQKTLYSDLESSISDLTQINDGSQTMKGDFVNLYNFQYLQNVFFLIGIFIIFLLFGKLFKDKIANIATNPTTASTSIQNVDIKPY